MLNRGLALCMHVDAVHLTDFLSTDQGPQGQDTAADPTLCSRHPARLGL